MGAAIIAVLLLALGKTHRRQKHKSHLESDGNFPVDVGFSTSLLVVPVCCPAAILE